MLSLHESAEDYLETILILKQRQGLVRSIDVVNETGYSKPSVSVSLKRLILWNSALKELSSRTV